GETIGWTTRFWAVGFAWLVTAAAWQPSVQLDNRGHGHSVATSVGQRIEITLQTIGPGQYGQPQVTSPSVRFIGMSPTGPVNPGGPRQLFLFEAVGPGSAVINIPHSRGTAFTVTIDVSG